MFGELDFAGKFQDAQYKETIGLIVVSFIIFIGIIIVNFLIGLSIDNMSGLFKTAGVERLRLALKQVKKKRRISSQEVKLRRQNESNFWLKYGGWLSIL